MKKCRICNETKPLTEFYKNKKASDGLQWQCKVCKKEDKKINEGIHDRDILSRPLSNPEIKPLTGDINGISKLPIFLTASLKSLKIELNTIIFINP